MNVSEALGATGSVFFVLTFAASGFPIVSRTKWVQVTGGAVTAVLSVITIGLVIAAIWTGVQW